MGRALRTTPGGYVYHVLNRANGRATLFRKDDDYAAFLRVLAEAQQEHPLRLLSFCLMPNHWHLLVWPEADDQVSAFMHWLTLTHSQRWLAHYHRAGTGHVYQGRFKSFPVASDEHFLTVYRYVERNALRAQLVERAELWRWGSLWLRTHADNPVGIALSDWPLPMPRNWCRWVNAALTEAELQAVRQSVQRGRPFGSEPWVRQTAAALQLTMTLRPRGRPRKTQPAGLSVDQVEDEKGS
jgi:putative transposase